MTFSPTIAYRINDWHSLGGGPQIMYADLEMKAKAPLPGPGGNGEVTINGNDVAFGFGLGALFEVNERTRIGLVYQSEIEPEFDGDVEISPPGAYGCDGYHTHICTIYSAFRLSRTQRPVGLAGHRGLGRLEHV
jgi:long-chain fatty acid transport protein